MKIHFTSFITILILAGCVTTQPQPEAEPSAYLQQINEWHSTRNERLNQPDGWLTLSGLFWLEEGDNPFGSSSENKLVFRGKDIPEIMGNLRVQGDSVSFTSAAGIQIAKNESIVSQSGLKKDSSGEPDILTWGSLTWYIIERGDRLGVRLKDSQHPNFVNFKPTELFPIDSSWRLEATLEVIDSSRTVSIVNVLGDETPNPTPGLLHFELNGQDLTLTPLADPGDENYFIIFGDETNGFSTYGAGRFLVIPAVDENNMTTIDFNKSYNMPCVFSPYATCPLPPLENLLSIAIEAGEKDYHIRGGH